MESAVGHEEVRVIDVHPPHGAVHGWRDFFIHIATIVIGLLIAIGLEQTVEWVHHRHVVHQARASLMEEVRENRDTVNKDQRALVGSREQMRRNIALLQNRAKDAAAAETVKFGLYWNGPGKAALDTARETGALGLMPYEEVNLLTSMYDQQTLVNENAVVYIQTENAASTGLQLHARVGDMTQAEVNEMIAACAQTINKLDFLEVVIQGLQENYDTVLKRAE